MELWEFYNVCQLEHIYTNGERGRSYNYRKHDPGNASCQTMRDVQLDISMVFLNQSQRDDTQLSFP